MKNYDQVQWEYQEESSLAENMENLAQGINLLAKTLDSIGYAQDVSQQDGCIHPYTFIFLGQVAQGMANEALKIVGQCMRTRNRGPAKLVPIIRNDEAEGEEKQDGQEQ